MYQGEIPDLYTLDPIGKTTCILGHYWLETAPKMAYRNSRVLSRTSRFKKKNRKLNPQDKWLMRNVISEESPLENVGTNRYKTRLKTIYVS